MGFRRDNRCRRMRYLDDEELERVWEVLDFTFWVDSPS